MKMNMLFGTAYSVSSKGARAMKWFAHLGRFHHRNTSEQSVPQTAGLVLTWARRYDLLVPLVTLGREQALRRMTVDLAQLHPGESVLDVGCGTGTLTLVAKRRVGDAGRVAGIDPAPQMIARARQKAARRGLAIELHVDVIERLPFPDRSFDVVLSSLMMHHLPDELKRQGLTEIARVLKSGGRLLVVDGMPMAGPWRSHIQDQPSLMREAGFSLIETGNTRFPGIGYALGRLDGATARKPTQ
jgi:ubiquinone/menaquinone biosynthesis C-methylase UbiE